MKFTLRVLKFVLIAFLVLVFSISAYILVSKVIFKQRNPKVFGYSVMVVKTGSMYPELKQNDLIIIKNQNKYKSRDIITFKDGNNFTTHRIVAVVEDGFITQGDANNAPDNNTIKYDDIEGRVIGKVGGVGNVVNFIISPYGMISIVFTCVIIIIFSYVIRAIKRNN